jgi:septum formation protein
MHTIVTAGAVIFFCVVCARYHNMKYNSLLYVASSSDTRQKLLSESRIPYVVVSHHADETAYNPDQHPRDIIKQIACLKMESVALPCYKDHKDRGGSVYAYVLTSDTVSVDSSGRMFGKHESHESAYDQLKNASGWHTIYTSFCIDRKIYYDNAWHVDKRMCDVVETEYYFNVPDEYIDDYIAYCEAFKVSRAIAIDDYGMQFMKEVRGSYSAILGLPLFQIRCALKELGFIQ